MKATRTYLKRVVIFSLILLATLVFGSAADAQINSVDLSFNAIPDKDAASPANFILQPDGKIIVFGNFQVVNGVLNNQIARLNPDGSLDNTFNCTACNFGIGSAILQPDGKIIVAGGTSDNSSTSAVVYRLTSDGSRDFSFTSAFAPVGFPNSQWASVRTVQPDGKILVVLSSSASGFTSDSLYRLNPDGTFDVSFTPAAVGGGRLVRQILGKILVLPDGKILVAANTFSAGNSSAALLRFNADGTRDMTFEAPNFSPSGSLPGSFVSDMELLADGSILIVGRFTGINAVSRQNVAKLLPAGNVDLSFNNSNIGEATGIEVLPNGKFLISTASRFYRLNPDGSLDLTFNSPSSLTQINSWAVDASGNIVVNGAFFNNASVNTFARLNADGSIANSFTVGFGVSASITTLAAQADGKVIFAGDFTRVGGVRRVSIARVNADGSLDTTFNANNGFDNVVEKIVVQPDGKILVGGQFNSFNNVSTEPGLVRLNADGSADVNFNFHSILPPSTVVYAIAVQPDGKIIIGGVFGIVNGLTRTGIARLNADGTIDASFNPVFGNAAIRSIVVEANGKILVGGSFNGVNGFSRANLVRLNSDGTLDTSFVVGSIGGVRQIEVQNDGKYIVLTTNIIRFNNNGTTDASFQPPSFDQAINAILVLPDGSIIVGGQFTLVSGISRFRLTRLRSDGRVDVGFFPTGANNQIRAVTQQTDGRVLVGGDFWVVGGITRLGIARLNVVPFRNVTPYDFDGDGKADLSVFRPSSGTWYWINSSSSVWSGRQFGANNDRPAPADYDGDARTDTAVFRDVVPGAGNFAYFYIINSLDNSFRPVQFGTTGDVPVSGDWDGDGKADLAVYRDGSLTGGQSYFYYRPSSQPSVNFRQIAWGTTGDKPLIGDFDGDLRLDAAVFRPSTATWHILRSSNNQVSSFVFGLPTDIPVPADYDGDGVTNIAVFRPSNGTWYTSTNPQINYGAVQFGTTGDLPVPADYDGDGKADVAVYRPSNGAWYLLRSTQGFDGKAFGIAEDNPIPYSFIR